MTDHTPEQDVALDYSEQDALADLNAIAALVNDQHGDYSREFIAQVHNSRFIPLRDFILAQSTRLKEAEEALEAKSYSIGYLLGICDRLRERLRAAGLDGDGWFVDATAAYRNPTETPERPSIPGFDLSAVPEGATITSIKLGDVELCPTCGGEATPEGRRHRHHFVTGYLSTWHPVDKSHPSASDSVINSTEDCPDPCHGRRSMAVSERDALVTIARLVSESDNQHGERHAWAVLIVGPLAEVATTPADHVNLGRALPDDDIDEHLEDIEEEGG